MGRHTSSRHDREQQLAAILKAGTAKSTRRAYERDIHYFWAWAQLALQQSETYPVDEEMVIHFILDHVGQMPSSLEQQLIKQKLRRKTGHLKVSTLRRLLASLSVTHTEHGYPTPTHSSQVRLLLRRAQQLQAEQGKRQMRAITKDILHALIDTCDDSLHGTRDKALLLVGFASGGRRRSELVNLEVNDLEKVPAGYLLSVRKSKTDQTGKGHTVPLLGMAANAVTEWLVQSGIRNGKLFRGIRGKAVLSKSICGDAIYKMVRRRIALIGLNPKDYGAHSLRAGFLTQAAQAGTTLGDAMALSGHHNTQTAQQYYQHATILNNPASRLLDEE